MKKCFFILTLFIVFYSYGQQSKIDSLKKEFSKENNIKKQIIILSELNDLLLGNNDKETEVYALKFIELTGKDKNYKLKTKALNDYSIILAYFGNYTKSIIYAKKSIFLSDSINYVEQQINCRDNISRIYLDLQKQDSSRIHAENALVIGNDNKYYKYHSKLYYVLARLAYDSEDELNAINYYLKIIDFAKKYKDYYSLSDSYIGLSFIFKDKKDYKKAKSYALKGLDLFVKEDEEYRKIDFYRLLGQIFSGEKNKDSAYFYKLKYFELSKKLNNDLYIFDSATNLAYHFLNTADYKNAEKFAKYAISKSSDDFKVTPLAILMQINIKNKKVIEAEKYLKMIFKDTTNLPMYIKDELYQDYIDFYRLKKDYRNEAKYLTLVMSRKDSTLYSDYRKKTHELEIKFQTTKKENENLELKQENTKKEMELLKQSRRNWFLGVGLSLSLLGIGAYSYFYRKTKRQKELIENLQVELHHTVKNNLSFISTFIDLTIDDVEEDKIQNKLIELKQRIESINEVHKELYAMKGETQVKMKKYIQRISSLVNDSYSNKKVVFGQNIDESIVLSPNNSFPIGLIINEFLTNSYKYAFKNITNPTINIDFSHHVNQYILKLSDNGVGLNNIDIENESFGLNLMRNLSKQLGGSYNIDGQNGVTILIKFPVKH